MSARNDGGPAFPQKKITQLIASEDGSVAEPVYEVVGGMSLRDYFAGQALQGVMASGSVQLMKNEDAVAMSYRVADLMLAERAKGGGQ